MNRFFEENDKSKYLTLVPTDESNEKIKKYQELWSNNQKLGYFEKIKFNSGDELTVNKTIEIPSITIVVRSVFYENNKYYLKIF